MSAYGCLAFHGKLSFNELGENSVHLAVQRHSFPSVQIDVTSGQKLSLSWLLHQGQLLPCRLYAAEAAAASWSGGPRREGNVRTKFPATMQNTTNTGSGQAPFSIPLSAISLSLWYTEMPKHPSAQNSGNGQRYKRSIILRNTKREITKLSHLRTFGLRFHGEAHVVSVTKKGQTKGHSRLSQLPMQALTAGAKEIGFVPCRTRRDGQQLPQNSMSGMCKVKSATAYRKGGRRKGMVPLQVFITSFALNTF